MHTELELNFFALYSLQPITVILLFISRKMQHRRDRVERAFPDLRGRGNKDTGYWHCDRHCDRKQHIPHSIRLGQVALIMQSDLNLKVRLNKNVTAVTL